MYRIVQAVWKTDLASILDDIRSWLEHHGCSAASLIIEVETMTIATVQVDFNYLDLAVAFAKAFQGQGPSPPLVSALG